ncbi:MAG: hypothetical protein KDC18_18405 [Alphaproteobacteria bacterium]|nr:hypothetical protein [Alphaproteobacteria bacterium]MCB9930495.1 hypothetical protein [Alphaproteobacteria bacterium]
MPTEELFGNYHFFVLDTADGYELVYGRDGRYESLDFDSFSYDKTDDGGLRLVLDDTKGNEIIAVELDAGQKVTADADAWADGFDGSDVGLESAVLIGQGTIETFTATDDLWQ